MFAGDERLAGVSTSQKKTRPEMSWTGGTWQRPKQCWLMAEGMSVKGVEERRRKVKRGGRRCELKEGCHVLSSEGCAKMR